MNKLNECDGKVQFISLSKANQAVKGFNTGNKKRVNSYKCSSCGYYHIGHETKQRMLPNKIRHRIDYTHEGSVHNVVESKYLKRLKL